MMIGFVFLRPSVATLPVRNANSAPIGVWLGVLTPNPRILPLKLLDADFSVWRNEVAAITASVVISLDAWGDGRHQSTDGADVSGSWFVTRH